MRRPDDPSVDTSSVVEQPLSRQARQMLQIDFLVQDPGLEDLTLQERLRTWCQEALDRRGKVAGLVAIARVADAFATMDREERDGFYRMLIRHFSVDAKDVEEAVQAYLAATGPRARELARLTSVLESPRLQLYRQFNTVPQGIKFLLDLRADVDSRLKEDPDLWLMESELRHLLESWFNIGFLRLERITWASPAALLEKLVEYEAVHAIASWEDLKRRLHADRACFAFLHPAMPTEPVIFMVVALVRGLAGCIQDLLDPRAPALEPQRADTAIFYSITNAQRGLRGIPFGNLLIKQAAARLRSELPNLQTFSTLSPIPHFNDDYLQLAIEDGSIAGSFAPDEAERLCALTGEAEVARAVASVLATPAWPRNSRLAEALRPGLLRAARTYLTERQRLGRVACPVGHFHGSNGAKLGRINWLGDTSAVGMARSCGMMVNYLYELDMFDQFQADYTRTGRLPVDEAVQLL
jgi:malonyl-CoA decarboxylase